MGEMADFALDQMMDDDERYCKGEIDEETGYPVRSPFQNQTRRYYGPRKEKHPMTENVNKGKLTTPLFRLSFAQLDKPKAFENGDPKYGLTMLFPKGTDLSPLKKLAYNAVVDKWGSDKKSWPVGLRTIDWKTYLSSTGKDGWPFRDGDLQDYDGYAGQVSISCKNTIKPVVVDAQKRPIIDMNEVYSGCYGHAVITSYAYENKSKGVTFSLLAFMKVKDGEPFTRRFDPDTDFAGIDYSDMAESGEFADEDVLF